MRSRQSVRVRVRPGGLGAFLVSFVFLPAPSMLNSSASSKKCNRSVTDNIGAAPSVLLFVPLLEQSRCHRPSTEKEHLGRLTSWCDGQPAHGDINELSRTKVANKGTRSRTSRHRSPARAANRAAASRADKAVSAKAVSKIDKIKEPRRKRRGCNGSPKVPSRRLRRRTHGHRHGRSGQRRRSNQFGKARPQVDVRLYAAFVATRSVAIEGCTVDHVVQTNTAQRLSEFLLGN